MMNGDAPCKGCKDRIVEPNCHMTCPKYLEFTSKKKRENNNRKMVEAAHFMDSSRIAKEYNRIQY